MDEDDTRAVASWNPHHRTHPTYGDRTSVGRRASEDYASIGDGGGNLAVAPYEEGYGERDSDMDDEEDQTNTSAGASASNAVGELKNAFYTKHHTLAGDSIRGGTWASHRAQRRSATSSRTRLKVLTEEAE
jgi:hypothetical protein